MELDRFVNEARTRAERPPGWRSGARGSPLQELRRVTRTLTRETNQACLVDLAADVGVESDDTDRLQPLGQCHEGSRCGPAEAAPLYAELMRDPGPPDVEADELEQFVFRQYAFREECARALFECCRLTADLPGLQRAYQELQDVLRALAADAGISMGSEGTEPGAVTQARYEAIYAELTRGTSAASD